MLFWMKSLSFIVYIGWMTQMSKSPKDSILGHFLNLLQSLIHYTLNTTLYLECRFAKYYQTDGYDSRDLIKAYGIVFKVEVTGTVLINNNLINLPCHVILCFHFAGKSI